ncbi:MAG TPA: plastocyanin/azurin family copper-binding protein [Longimicrobium sp.]|jgi:plastocyanin|nr:plastocyanin/azurin family copper-binding protein [Longimicrobium sp.]
MSMRAIYSFACAAFAAVVTAGGLAGCFSEHVSVTAPTGQELCVGAQAADVVRIVDFGFSPAQVTVPKGGKVTWVNCSASATQHTSTSDTGVWDSGFLAQYATHQQTYAAAGSFAYHCNPHPFMKGTIVVQP